ncbi:DUF5333 domain-containing protein [Yoonia sp. 208BN28-4]|uniref:DUF5333 domain-containing protein n=1 Tax=Yoonia sp. 208BN28-4 TaxID=3126505 RepID=UPI0030B17649
MKTPAIVTAAAMTVAMLAGNASAQSNLRDVTEITEGLIAVGTAVEISDKCGSIGPRNFRGLAYLNSLRNRAVALGFSASQIDDFTDDKAEQDRLEAIARARLADKGVVEGREETYCAVGRAEMAANSAIGRLLY